MNFKAKLSITLLAASALASPALAQSMQPTVGLQNMAIAQQQNQDAQQSAIAAAQAQANAEQARQDRIERIRAEQLDKIYQQRHAFQKKEQDLTVQEQELKLQQLKDRTNMDNGFLQAQLKQMNAETNVTQSVANANNITAKAAATAAINESEGDKTLLSDTGEARLEASKTPDKKH